MTQVVDLGNWAAPADQTDRTFVITGASSGLGAVAARVLAGAGGRVVLAVRDTARGRAVAEAITGDTEVRELDLTNLASVRRFADGVGTDVDVLINNAGVLGVPFATTVDGFETQLAVNHLGPFALTGLLLPRIRDRVVTVTSQAQRQGILDLDDPHWSRRPYRPFAAYAQSKLALLMSALELHRRLEAVGSPVRSIAVHPGVARSNIMATSARTVQLRVLGVAQRLMGQSTEAGAASLVCGATADLPGGVYIGPGGRTGLRGPLHVADPGPAASDPVTAGRLWQLSQDATGVAYPFAAAAKDPAPPA